MSGSLDDIISDYEDDDDAITHWELMLEACPDEPWADQLQDLDPTSMTDRIQIDNMLEETIPDEHADEVDKALDNVREQLDVEVT